MAEPFSLAFVADVAMAAGALGILWLVYLKFRATTILIPLAILCGSGAAMGLVSAAIHLLATGDAASREVATQLVYTGLIVSSMALPAFAHLLVLYPRRILHPVAQYLVGTLYVLGLIHAALAPTGLVVAQMDTMSGEPYAKLAPTEPFLLAPAYVVLIGAIGWLFYIAWRGRVESEKTNARMLLVSVLPAAFFMVGLVPLGWPVRDTTLPTAETIAFGWGILFAGAAIYRGRWRPPVPQGLQPILDASTDAILIVDDNARVSTANQAARDLADLGQRRPEGMALLDALPAEVAEQASELLTMSVMGVIRGRIERNTHQVRARQPGGRSFTVSVLPVGQGETGTARGALIMIRDETSRIALADATARLANLQDLVIRVMGHDVKTPIAVIQGYAELAQGVAEGPVDAKGAEEIRRYMERVLEAVTSSQLILSNARAISRLSSGPGSSVAFEDLDISQMARQASEVMSPLAASKRLTLGVDVIDGLYARAPKGFESVFMNLLSNAVKYTPPGGQVQLSMRLEDGRAVTRVADTGPGVRAESRAKLFAKFERLDADKGNIEGQGLGLSIVASFVDLVGGHIRVEDRPDGRAGSVFVVELLASERPRAGAASARGEAATSSSRAGS